MSRVSKTAGSGRRGRGQYARVFGVAAAVCALIYWEQTALLYVLSVLAVCGLLLVVAFSDLEGRDRELNEPAFEEVAAVGTGLSAADAAGARKGRAAGVAVVRPSPRA